MAKPTKAQREKRRRENRARDAKYRRELATRRKAVAQGKRVDYEAPAAKKRSWWERLFGG